MRHGIGNPVYTLAPVQFGAYLVFGQSTVANQQVLPFGRATIFARFRNCGVQRPVIGFHAPFHILDIFQPHSQFACHISAAVMGHGCAEIVNFGAQTAHVEKQGFLRGRCAGTHNRPVAQHIVLD